ncbi:MAG TPA: helix-turn-helix transcriptional regulator [Gemmata sp.]|jgi:DNA-binding XRE family transcriptional regulator|nr:helix-turn-helix transcriptional regulator [Gemmata sp.]
MGKGKKTPRDLVPGFAPLVTRARESRGWTRRALAVAAGVSPQTVGDVEDERRSPSLRVAAALAEALGLVVLLHRPADPLSEKFPPAPTP